MEKNLCLLENNGCGFAVIGTGSKVLRDQPVDDIKYTAIIQSVLALLFVLIWSALNVIKIHHEKYFVIEMESSRVSASDFTLMIEDFPKTYLEGSRE